MSELKRDKIKYIRDRAKSAYVKDEECYICGGDKELDFHHFFSVTELLNKWIKEKNLVVLTAEDMMGIRDEFIDIHHKEIYDDTVTLCHTHHLKLHSIYGKKPSLITGPKQKRWVNKRREKEYGNVTKIGAT
jgi:hypothetical protein